MRNLITYFFVALIMLSAPVQAQQADSAYTTIDTVVPAEDYTDEAEAEEKESRFTPFTSFDKEQIVERKVSDSAVNAMRKDDDFWYVNEAPVKEMPQEPKESYLQKLAKEKWFRNLMWFLVVGGFVAVLIWFIVSSDIQLFKKKPRTVVKTQEEELVNQSIFDIDYDSEIQKAIASQNLRLAVRLLYLQTLKKLSEANIIQYKQERTNNDYLMQLFNTAYHKDFFRLTRHFEYVWYGQFPITPANFDVIKADFFTFKQRFLS